jgi:hypothetical protein
MFLRALAGCEKALGLNHMLTLSTVNNLRDLYRNQDKLAEAEQIHLRALAGCEKALGPDHTLTLNTVNNLGLLYGNQGKLAEAEEMYLRRWPGKRRRWDPITRPPFPPSIISGTCIVTKASWLRRSRCTCGRWPGARRR